MRAFCLALALVAFASSGALADPLAITFRIETTGDAPKGIRIDDGAAGADLSSTSNGAPFGGSIAVLNDFAFHAATLIAEYSNGPDQSIPLRLGPGVTTVVLRIPRLSNIVCDNTTVTSVEQDTDEPNDLVDEYLVARSLHYSDGDVTAPCGSLMKHRVDRAWFDRSYGLTRLRPFFALDQVAERALASSDPQYVNTYVAQDAAHIVAQINDVRVHSTAYGDVATAVAASDSIVSQLKGDTKLLAAFETYQRLPLHQLEAEGATLRAQLNTAPSSPDNSVADIADLAEVVSSTKQILDLMQQSCSGGPHGVDPESYDRLVQIVDLIQGEIAAIDSLQSNNLTQTTSSSLSLMTNVISQMRQIAGLMRNSCAGGTHGVNPAHFSDAVNLANAAVEKLSAVKMKLSAKS